jgi:hypothetical protein
VDPEWDDDIYELVTILRIGNNTGDNSNGKRREEGETEKVGREEMR